MLFNLTADINAIETNKNVSMFNLKPVECREESCRHPQRTHSLQASILTMFAVNIRGSPEYSG